MDKLKMEKLKLWSRTVWKEFNPDEHEEECVIPSTWVNQETRKVRWPKGINPIRAMNELRKPEDKWSIFDLVKVKVSSDSKDVCEEFDFTSAEITDEEKNSRQGDLHVEGKRISKKKTYPEFDTGDRASTPTPEKQSGKVDKPRSNPVPLPPLPPPPAPKSSLGDSRTSADNRSSSERSMSPPPTPRVSSGKSMNRVSRSSPEPTPSTSNMYSGRTSSPEPTPSTSYMSKGKRSAPEHTPSRSNMSKGKRSAPEHTPLRSNMSKGRRSAPEHTPSRSNMSKGRRSSPEPTPSRSNRVSDKYHAAPLRKRRRLPSPSIFENESRGSSWSSKSRSRSRSSRYRSRSRSSRYRSRSRSSRYSARSRRTRSRSLRRPRTRSPNHRSRSPGATSRKKTKSRNADHEKSEVKFQRRILYLLAEIRDLLKKDNMRSLQDYRFNQLDTIEDFLSKDQELENDAEIVSCKRYIMQIGGKKWTDHLKKAMLRCLTNKLMSEMNMKGKKTKHAFGDSNLFKIIRDAVVACSSHEGATESSIWRECGAFLKYAPERSGGVSRKKD